MKRRFLSLSVALPLLVAAPCLAQDKQGTEFDFGQSMQSIMMAASANKYDEALAVALEVLPQTQGLQRLQTLHLTIDLNRINDRWAEVPALVDEFHALYAETTIPPGRDSWATHIMSEKSAAAVKIENLDMARDASEKALKLYKNIAESWAVGAKGEWVSKNTGQTCPILMRGHIRYDAYDEENGDTSCRYWDSNMMGGVSLTVYKTNIKDADTAITYIVDKTKNSHELPPGGTVELSDVHADVKSAIPSNNYTQGYGIKGRFPQDGLIIFSPEKGQLLNMTYTAGDHAWAVKSLGKIKQNL